MKKLNVLLAKTDALGNVFKTALSNYSKFFNSQQGAFLGEKKTYTAIEGTIDEPNKRGNRNVQTTVNEKFDYFIENNEDYITSLFSQEKTNASNIAKAELFVGGKSWGEFTSLELLRLKGIVENAELYRMINNIPVRSDAENWEKCDAEAYQDRDITQLPELSGMNVTTVKEEYILKDPNVNTDSPNYNAQVAVRTTTMKLGAYTIQKYSGELSQRERAGILKRRTALTVGIIEALKTCNEVEAVESTLTSKKIFGYLFNR